MKIKQIFEALVAILICQAAGIIGSIFTANNIQTWYINLNKPFFNPPNWIFGPVWFTLYCLMGIALYLIWKKRNSIPQAKTGINIFLIHLVFNALWSIVFFALHQIALSVLNIIILLGLIIYLTRSFYKIDARAAYLMFPYVAWVSFASILNISLLILN